MDKCAVFIDGGYLQKVSAGLGYPKIDFLKLSEELAGQDKRLRTYYYDCPPHTGNNPSDEDRDRKRKFDQFIYSIKRIPRFEVRLGKLKRYKVRSDITFEQKMVDILLAIDLVKLSVEKSIQKAVIITNDTDFIPAIKVARDAGVIVELYRGGSDYNDALVEACDEWSNIDAALIKKIKR